MVYTVGFRQNNDSCVFLASINLSIAQRQSLKNIRHHISDCCDLVFDSWSRRDSNYFDYREAVDYYAGVKGKSEDYRDFVVKSALTHLNYLRASKEVRVKGSWYIFSK